MQINDSAYLSGLLGTGAPGAPGGSSTTATQFDPASLVLADTYGRATELGNALTELDQLITTAKPRSPRAAWAASANTLLLTSGALTATTLRSVEEINTTPTSFGPPGSDYAWQGTSDAQPALDGIYDQSNGTGTLTFESRRNGVHGEDNLRFWVRDPGGTVIDNFQVKSSDPIDQQYTLSNGLIFTLGEGAVENGDTFTVEVFTDIGSVVDPDKPMDGQGADDPNLQYGLSVTDGSFDINGVNIVVNSGDSISDVLARITASAADVTATFDSPTESILLTRNTPGSAYDISLTNDTSGFLAATKLDTATAERGTDGGLSTPIGELTQFAAVTSGIVQINGVDIAVDVDADSLDDILQRISDSDAFVAATLVNERVYLQSQYRRDNMTLDDGGTGLFDALYIKTGLYRPIDRDGVTQVRANEIAAATAEVGSAVNGLLGGVSSGGQSPVQVTALKGQVQSILDTLGSGLGDEAVESLGVEFESLRFELDITALVSSLRIDFSDVRAIFLGETEDARDGFVRQLLDVVNRFTSDLRSRSGTDGILTGLTA